MIKYDWKTIICSTCGTHYECTDGLETVADGCCATVTKKGYLVPGYFSQYDLHELVWDERPVYVENGYLCDKCIEEHINRKELVRLELPLDMISRLTEQ